MKWKLNWIDRIGSVLFRNTFVVYSASRWPWTASIIITIKIIDTPDLGWKCNESLLGQHETVQEKWIDSMLLVQWIIQEKIKRAKSDISIVIIIIRPTRKWMIKRHTNDVIHNLNFSAVFQNVWNKKMTHCCQSQFWIARHKTIFKHRDGTIYWIHRLLLLRY